jgi:2-polyprenyl-3-methyl-5-hydroxy-6-metoxy-1,4-benzoquinol methylase
MKVKLKRYFKNLLLSNKQKESRYYEDLFINNSNWNKPEPNYEELLRWEIIKRFLKIVNNRNSDDRIDILDLGCGRGWLSNLLSNYGDVVGIEPIKPVVEYAKKLFSHIHFLNGTAKKLLNDKKFDLIVSSEVIEHIPDLEKVNFIKDINNLLNKKGFLILTTPRKEALELWNSYLKPGQPIEDWITEEDLEKIIIQESFKTIKKERFSIPPVKGAPEIEIYQLWLFQKI